MAARRRMLIYLGIGTIVAFLLARLAMRGAENAGATGVAGRAPDRDTLEQTVRENRTSVERIGLRVIVFVLVWVAVGFEIAVLGAALVVGYLLVLRAVAGPSDTDVADSAPPATDIDDTATTAIATPAAAKVTEAPAPPPKTTRPAKRKPPAK